MGWRGSLRDLSKNILKQGLGKGKSCSYGEGGFEGVTTPAPPPPENFNHTLSARKTLREVRMDNRPKPKRTMQINPQTLALLEF